MHQAGRAALASCVRHSQSDKHVIANSGDAPGEACLACFHQPAAVIEYHPRQNIGFHGADIIWLYQQNMHSVPLIGLPR